MEEDYRRLIDREMGSLEESTNYHTKTLKIIGSTLKNVVSGTLDGILAIPTFARRFSGMLDAETSGNMPGYLDRVYQCFGSMGMIAIFTAFGTSPILAQGLKGDFGTEPYRFWSSLGFIVLSNAVSGYHEIHRNIKQKDIEEQASLVE